MLDQQLRRPAAVITYLTNQARWQPGLKLDEAKSPIRNFEISDWTGPICNFGISGFEISLRPISKSPPHWSRITQVYCCLLSIGRGLFTFRCSIFQRGFALPVG